MRSRFIIAAIALAVALPSVGGAQAIEVVAVRAILARGNVPKNRPLRLEPRLAVAGHAPAAFGAPRDASRSAAIAREMKADIGSIGDPSPGGTGASNNSRVFIALSEPVLSGDKATITVTGTFFVKGRFLGYETVAYTLHRVRGAWVVVRAEQLGVS